MKEVVTISSEFVFGADSMGHLILLFSIVPVRVQVSFYVLVFVLMESMGSRR